ncbi:MFS transporter [Amycolatopsis sp. MJM2582]|uniref:Conserved putative membrane protein n=1 Tax=Amycolatopsis japonica TaxID=208439 RepID=A0A075UKZ4_9PSEU|nr:MULTISPECIES: MFS transporter [Amycolatopsis]AIG73563.1 Conserved putative membrane protein [Amycolatopsis japonica]KFZ76689.1 MFS transporter [Amycolatopsis sp. MJM2582]OKJ97622.1 MFS transporter [Amycolatopsis sp. CB00013]RSN47787.1 MFS transporter [Amycolatopsis sp. WAC 04197]
MDATATTEDTRPFAWFRTLGSRGRRAFVGAFGGYGLDSFDYQTLPLGLAAITAYYGLSGGEAGLLGTTTLVVSAIGGIGAGVLADRIGRVRTLQITIAMYTVFTVLCGFAPNFETLLIFRALQGLGFGGEWAAGAALVAEYSQAKYRGRTVAFVQSAWAVGWALSVVVYTVVFSIWSPDVAWRVMFWTGVIPALLVLWVRRNVQDAPVAEAARATKKERGSLAGIFKPDLLRTTFFAALLATGVQGGYYTLATWLPSYLKTTRGLTVIGTGGYLAFLISGAFIGYVTGGYLTDLLGRKKTFLLFSVLSAGLIVAYTQIPAGANTLVLFLGFPLGFSMSAIFSGFGAFLAELYPSALRGTGQGFTYNLGRAIGATFPAVVGFLGAGGAMVFGAVGYGIAVLALLGLPETRGRELL